MGNIMSRIFGNRVNKKNEVKATGWNQEDQVKNSGLCAFEIQKEDLEFGDLIERGSYGFVHKGVFNNTREVAIRGSTSTDTEKFMKYLIAEAKVLCHIGNHPNVLSFIGVCKKEIGLYVVTEFCAGGSLKRYLQNQRRKRYVVASPEESPDESPYACIYNVPVDTNELCRFACEIAVGMEYIASKNVVHRDLAARNVLLDADLHCKIGDFSMAKILNEDPELLLDESEPLPWKWMAPESLDRLVFSSKSDVWAYGVTLWEIFSLGENPFPEIMWNVEFITELRNGLRLPMPKHSSQNIYDKMLECWSISPDDRPSFDDVNTFFCTAKC